MISTDETYIELFIAGIDHAFAQGDSKYLDKPAEAANVALLRRVYTTLLEGRVEEFAATLADDVELDITGLPAWNGNAKGRDAVLAMAAKNFSAVAEQKTTAEKLVAQGDQIVLLLQERGVFRESGESYHIQAAQWFTLCDGKVSSIREIVAIMD